MGGGDNPTSRIERKGEKELNFRIKKLRSEIEKIDLEWLIIDRSETPEGEVPKIDVLAGGSRKSDEIMECGEQMYEMGVRCSTGGRDGGSSS